MKSKRRIIRELSAKLEKASDMPPRKVLDIHVERLRLLTELHKGSTTMEHANALVDLSKFWVHQDRLTQALEAAAAAHTTVQDVLLHQELQGIPTKHGDRLAARRKIKYIRGVDHDTIPLVQRGHDVHHQEILRAEAAMSKLVCRLFESSITTAAVQKET